MSRARLLPHRLDHVRVAVADGADRNPREEVQVLPSLRVPEPGPLAAHELHRHARVGLHHLPLLQRLELGELHAVIFVPIPASVKSSSRS